MGIPEYFEGPVTARGDLDLGGFGVARLSVDPERPGELPGGRLRLQLRAPKLRVYDVWAAVDGSWYQLNRSPSDAELWVNEDLDGRLIGLLRLWVGAAWDTTLGPTTPRRATDDPPPEPVAPRAPAPYVPIVEGEPPLPRDRQEVDLPSRVRRWARRAQTDVLVTALLDEWTAACTEAAALGWMAGLPRGEDLPEVYARAAGADPRTVDHDQGFARWVTIELGRQARLGLRDRRDLEARRAGVKLLQRSLARLVRGLADDLLSDHAPPPLIGPGQRHEWLVDEALASAMDNAPATPGSHRPIFVLRPKLSRAGLVVVEGEVI